MKHIHTLLWFYAPPLAYMAAIFFVSAMPNPTFQGDTPDYVLHALEYFLLALLLIRLMLTRRPPDAPLTAWRALCAIGAALAIGYGLFDELHQYFVPGRHCSLHDVLADSFGALLAYGIGRLDSLMPSRCPSLTTTLQRMPGFARLSYAARHA